MRRASSAVLVALVVLACGETRRPIGEECLRDEDCLSGVCSASACVAAPALVTGTSGPEPNEEPRIPDGDGGRADGGRLDAGADGG